MVGLLKRTKLTASISESLVFSGSAQLSTDAEEVASMLLPSARVGGESSASELLAPDFMSAPPDSWLPLPSALGGLNGGEGSIGSED